jgi:HSP20 family protein
MSETQLDKAQTNGDLKAPLWRLTPDIDVYESDDEFLIQLDVPGASAESVNVQVIGTRVYVRAEQAAPREHMEVARAVFERQLELPRGVDVNSASAQLENGVLEIRLSKSASARRVKIAVNAN